MREGTLVGVKAKTFYPTKPGTWADGPWPPDQAFDLVAAGLLLGKSIGFIPLSLREPSADERPRMKAVRYIIESWILVEYAGCYLPMQPNAVVEEVLKASRSRTAPKANVTRTQIAQALDRLLSRPCADKNLEKNVRSVIDRR